MRQLLLILSTGLLAGEASAVRVTVQYEAEASTVVDQPFGMTVPRLTIVRGHMTYETSTPDLSPGDPMRGSFLMTGTWDFRAEFLGKVVKGSGSATSSTNLFGSPTLRFEDGSSSANPNVGDMTLDGVPDAGIGLGFAISGQAKDLPTDQLPEKFTFNPPPGGASHTFVLKSTTGQMLLQFRSFSQVAFSIKSIQLTGNVVSISWYSVNGKRYAIESSTDLIHWEIVRDGLIGTSVSTTATDDLAARYPSGAPTALYYRVLDRAPP